MSTKNKTKLETHLENVLNKKDRIEKVSAIKNTNPNAMCLAILFDQEDEPVVDFWVYTRKNIRVSFLLMNARQKMTDLHKNKSITCVIEYRDKDGKLTHIMPHGGMFIDELCEQYLSDDNMLHVVFCLENTFG